MGDDDGGDDDDDDDDDEFRCNDASTHEDCLYQNGILTWFGIERALIITSYSVFRENRFLHPPLPTAHTLNFQFFYCFDLEI